MKPPTSILAMCGGSQIKIIKASFLWRQMFIKIAQVRLKNSSWHNQSQIRSWELNDWFP